MKMRKQWIITCLLLAGIAAFLGSCSSQDDMPEPKVTKELKLVLNNNATRAAVGEQSEPIRLLPVEGTLKAEAYLIPVESENGWGMATRATNDSYTYHLVYNNNAGLVATTTGSVSFQNGAAKIELPTDLKEDADNVCVMLLKDDYQSVIFQKRRTSCKLIFDQTKYGSTLAYGIAAATKDAGSGNYTGSITLQNPYARIKNVILKTNSLNVSTLVDYIATFDIFNRGNITIGSVDTSNNTINTINTDISPDPGATGFLSQYHQESTLKDVSSRNPDGTANNGLMPEIFTPQDVFVIPGTEVISFKISEPNPDPENPENAKFVTFKFKLLAEKMGKQFSLSVFFKPDNN